MPNHILKRSEAEATQQAATPRRRSARNHWMKRPSPGRLKLIAAIVLLAVAAGVIGWALVSNASG